MKDKKLSTVRSVKYPKQLRHRVKKKENLNAVGYKGNFSMFQKGPICMNFQLPLGLAADPTCNPQASVFEELESKLKNQLSYKLDVYEGKVKEMLCSCQMGWMVKIGGKLPWDQVTGQLKTCVIAESVV